MVDLFPGRLLAGVVVPTTVAKDRSQRGKAVGPEAAGRGHASEATPRRGWTRAGVR